MGESFTVKLINFGPSWWTWVNMIIVEQLDNKYAISQTLQTMKQLSAVSFVWFLELPILKPTRLLATISKRCCFELISTALKKSEDWSKNGQRTGNSSLWNFYSLSTFPSLIYDSDLHFNQFSSESVEASIKFQFETFNSRLNSVLNEISLYKSNVRSLSRTC